MIQGTASSVGKSVITAGLCRVLLNRGYKVAPFKSQNMALNSFITKRGHEMGRAQVVQAEAAGLEPHIHMNPILLKPSTDKKAQVIVNGKVFKNMSAVEYHEYKPQLAEFVKQTFFELAKDYQYVIMEGAGSPAEINLREGDLVNMGMAALSDSPVIIVGDIDRGGVFASLYGTIALLNEEERRRVKGVIINKFRGDIEILKPGLTMLEELTGVPVLGVMPYTQLKIEDEDSLAERFRVSADDAKAIVISVIYLPHISNFTDFNVLETQRDVKLNFVMRGSAIPPSDIVIIPGSKNTIEDMMYLHQSGLTKQIIRHQREGKMVIGICGGHQMLGELIEDPLGTESSLPSINGLGLLPMTTVFDPQKTTTQVSGKLGQLNGKLAPLSGMPVSGYEIHMGQTELKRGSTPLLTIDSELGKAVRRLDGAHSETGNVFGTYLHGIFDDIAFTRSLLNIVRAEKGLAPEESAIEDFKTFKEREYNRLADLLETHLDVDEIIKIMDDWQ